MKLYLKDSERTVLIKDEDEHLDIHEIFEVFRDACMAMGYHPNSFKEAIISLADEFDTSNEEE